MCTIEKRVESTRQSYEMEETGAQSIKLVALRSSVHMDWTLPSVRLCCLWGNKTQRPTYR